MTKPHPPKPTDPLCPCALPSLVAVLHEVFDLPPPPSDDAEEGAAPAEEGAAADAAAPESALSTAASASAAAVDEAHVEIPPERCLPIDRGSEAARAAAALGQAAAERRRTQRLRLRERFAQLNELVDQPRHQLSLM